MLHVPQYGLNDDATPTTKTERRSPERARLLIELSLVHERLRATSDRIVALADARAHEEE